MSQPTPVQGWSELLLALPEFVLTDAYIDGSNELVARIELPRDVQACPDCGVMIVARSGFTADDAGGPARWPRW